MLTSLHLNKKSSEVSIQGQDTKHTTVKWPIASDYNYKPSA